MRVLVVTNMYPTAANPTYGIFVAEQVNALRKADPTLSIDVHFINPHQEGKRVYLKSINRLWKQIDSGSYDLIHIHYGLSGLFLLHPLRRLRIPVIVTLHGGDIQPEQGKRVQVALTRRILKRADCAIALNVRMADLAAECTKKVELIPCAVNTSLFTPPANNRQPLKGKKNLTIIFPSAHSRVVKNYPLFVKTVNRLEHEMGYEIKEIELDGMSRMQTAATMRDADMMLMTSISEGSPQVVKEAMASNLPIVTTPVGDVKTLLDGVANSMWATPSELAEAVAKVAGEGIDGIDGRQKIMELGLDADSISRRILDLYNSLVSK